MMPSDGVMLGTRGWRPRRGAAAAILLVMADAAGCGGDGIPHLPVAFLPARGGVWQGACSPGEQALMTMAASATAAARPNKQPWRERLADVDILVPPIKSEERGVVGEGEIFGDESDSWEVNLAKMMMESGGTIDEDQDMSPGVQQWAKRQRGLFRTGGLAKAREERLEASGFHWRSPERVWMNRFLCLCYCLQQHGSEDIPGMRNGTRSLLGDWLSVQRRAWLKGSLSQQRRRLLASVGVPTRKKGLSRTFRLEGPRRRSRTPVSKQKAAWHWQEMLGQLMCLRMRHGSCSFPAGEADLSGWLSELQSTYRSGRLDVERQQAVEGLGIVFDLNRVRWIERYRELLAFQRGSNGTWTGRLGKRGLATKEPRLSQWAKRQVRASQKGILSPTRARLLERLGIKGLCTGDKEDWRGMFTELRKYQNNCNDVSVGYGWAINPRLGGWVHKQRLLQRSGELLLARERMLRETGFVFGGTKRSWEGRVVELESFKLRYGHINVPQGFLGNPPLGNWVHNVRQRQKRGGISHDRAARLDAMGFTWDLSSAGRDVWEQRLRELMLFRLAQGHSLVPQHHSPSPSLGRWVAQQRHAMAKGGLPADRAGVLQGLGLSYRGGEGGDVPIIGRQWGLKQETSNSSSAACSPGGREEDCMQRGASSALESSAAEERNVEGKEMGDESTADGQRLGCAETPCKNERALRRESSQEAGGDEVPASAVVGAAGAASTMLGTAVQNKRRKMGGGGFEGGSNGLGSQRQARDKPGLV